MTILVVGLLAVVFGGLILALVAGYVETEERRASQSPNGSEAARFPALPAEPRFFAAPPNRQASTAELDEALLSRLQQHVSAEQDLVSQFLREPSVDGLYRRTNSPRHAI